MLRKSWLGLLVVVLVAALLRLWQIDVIPPGFHFDESFEGLEAWRILTDPAYRPIFLTGNFGVGPVNAYANALTFGLFQFFGGKQGVCLAQPHGRDSVDVLHRRRAAPGAGLLERETLSGSG